MSHVTFHMSHVTCRMLRVTCHLSLTPTATATDPSPANSPIMHSRLVCQPNFSPSSKAQSHWNNKKTNTSRGMPILPIRSSTRSLQFTGKRGFHDGRQTDNLRTSRLRAWLNQPSGPIQWKKEKNAVTKKSLLGKLLFKIDPTVGGILIQDQQSEDKALNC